MNKYYSNASRGVLVAVLIISAFLSNLNAQNFNESTLNFNGNGSLGGITSLMYGPDGRLYVAEYTGAIKILTVQRNTATNYVVTSIEELDGIQTIQDHDDDGALNSAISRQTTGLTVAGTAANPIIYVTSSDIRIGAGDPNSSIGSNGDVNLDTNSGVITRFTWNGSSWDVVDLVRGLPRSEENHATNGLQLTNINGTNYLLVASGGFTNGGSPSTNFVFASEYALSGAILSVDLDAINALPPQLDNGRSFLYDLPTLDDPTRANANGIIDPDNPNYDGIDLGDPFGGNDGLNQAVVVPGGPVQIFSPGYRNSYDLVVTQSGALYVTDNGPNVGWGGFPENEGTSNPTNNYLPAEPGSQTQSGGEIINNEDHLELVTTNLQAYVPGSVYGGHPNPTRANPNGAGLYTVPGTGSTNAGGVFRTLIYDPDGSRGAGYTTDTSIALPANWPPVAVANAVEGDYRGPGITNPDGPDDNEITTWATNTNGIAEYTASNFGGQMTGNLLAGSSNSGNIRRVQLDANGLLQNLSQNFISTGAGNVLGITCNGDTDVFPGTVWVGTFGFTSGTISVFEPADAVVCINPGEAGYDPNADYDSDGYSNQDEEDNNTDPCNGGSQPADFDQVLGAPFISDLNDTDDDGDGILDQDDPFQLGDVTSSGSDAFTIPISNDLTNGQQGLGGFLDLGMTGLMNNGDGGPNWLNWIDRPNDPNDPNVNDILGGATGLMTSHMTSGTAFGMTNTQEKGYQYGIQTNASTGIFTVSGNLISLSGGVRLYSNTAAVGGELGHFIGDGTQSNYIKVVLTTNGITAFQEIDDVPQAPINVNIPIANRPTNGIIFYFVVDPSNGEVVLEYSADGGARINIGTIIAQGSILDAIQQANQDLAVGFTGTSGTAGVELEGTWDFLSVFGEVPVVTNEIPDLTRFVNSSDETLNLNDFFADDNGLGNLTYTIQSNSNTAIGAVVTGNNLTLSYPSTPNVSTITVRATDADGLSVDETFMVTVTDAPIVLYRVNAGGPQINAIDGGIDWEADTTSANSMNLSIAGTNQTFSSTNIPVDASVNQITTPLDVYASERFDSAPGAPNITYSFPVSGNGNYEIRLYIGNSFSGTSQPGQRIFDASIEGIILPLLDNIDLSGTYGHEVGTVISHTLNITDGSIDISLPHVGPENPIVNAIEILDAPDNETPIYVYPVANQFNAPSDVLNGSLGVNAFGGDGNLQYSASGLPPGVNIEPTNGQIGGTIGTGATAGSPYNVTITVNDSDASNTDTVSTSFIWTIGSNIWVDKNENENYTARHECSFVQAGDRFYLMGGRENAQTVDVYDYANDTWENLTASAPREFNHFQATEYQGLIWVIGAFGDNGFPNEIPEEFIWAFDPSTQEWIQGPQIPAARRRGSTGLVVQNNKFYIVGGNTDGHDGGFVPWFDEYDPATGIWTPLANAPRARDHFSAAVIGNNLYLAGGRLSGGTGGTFAPTIPEVDVYDFGSNTWSTLPAAQNIPTPRGGSSSVTFNEKLVVIGGEVENQLVYGVNTSDALRITEEYDPATQTWTRLADLNSERHGTQAIVSGSGIFTLAGSPTLGGGNPPNQRNMEFLGIDNPVGVPSTTSILSAPENVLFADGTIQNIAVDVINGNVGILISSMEITGPNATDYTFTAGELTNQLLNPNGSHTISVALSASTGANRSALLTINYGNGDSITINLANFDSSLNVTNPGTQNNNEGDVVTLQLQAVGASTYSATGLPPTLNIDPNTGLISGTISTAGANDGPFLEENGLVIIEAESGVIVPTWIETTIGGANGIMAGTNHLSIQNGGTIPYQVTVSTPGVYRFNWRSFYSGSNPTDENDNWVRFPNDNGVWFFGFQGTPANEASLITNVTSATPSNIVFPNGSPRVTVDTSPEGESTNGYFKIFRSGGASEVYDWQALTSDNDSHNIYVYFENAGTFTMEVSERSAGHAIDKIALYKVDGTNFSDSQLTAAQESERAIGGGAADGSPYTVTVTVEDNGVPPSNASTQFIWNVGEAGDPIAIATAEPVSGFAPLDVNFTGDTSTDDIGIVSYLWNFGDGTPTSNSPNPMHTFTDVGTYNVQLTVEDGDANTNATDLIITVTDPAGAGTIRINSGGPTFTFNGVDWNLDQHFVGGTAFENSVSIANTMNDQLYQTERFNDTGTLTYEIPVVAGNYNVNLHFAELFFGLPGLGSGGGAGSRVFDVTIENGQGQLDDYDIFVSAGGAGTAIIENFSNIVVNDGNLTITLTGSIENPKISGIEVILPGGNSAPEVFAGEDQNIALSSTMLDGSATDADGGGIASFEWTQVSGPTTAAIGSANSDDTVISDLSQGVYVFRLTAIDEEDDSGFDDVTVTIDGAPGSLLINSGGPTFNFGTEEWTEDQFFIGGTTFESVVPIANTMNDQLYQTERFDDSGVLVYEIPVALAADYNVDLHFAELFFGQPGLGSAGGAGSRVFNIDIENGQVQINDYDIFVSAGGSATAIIESYKAITVNDGSLTITLTGVVENPKISGIAVFDTTPPIADAGANQSIDLPVDTVTLSGAGTDPDGGTIEIYQWIQVSGPSSAELSDDNTATLVADDLEAGEYVFRLTVTDDENVTGSDDVIVTVVPEVGNQAPIAVAEATPLSGNAPLEVTFTGSNSTDDVGIVTYTWDFMDGNISSEADPIHTFTADGIYDVELTVTDGEGLTDTAIITITVGSGENQAPTAIAVATPLSGNAPLEVTFTGSNSTDDVGIVTYAWDFMNGNTSSEADPIQTFTADGTYDVELTVTDGEGLTDTAIVTIIVGGGGNQAPIAVAEATPLSGVSPLNVIFVGSNSTDDVEIISYAWDFMDGNTSTEADPVNTFTADGTYNVQLTVTDGEGLTDTATIIIVVGDGTNQPPTALIAANPTEGKASLLVQFDGSESFDDVGVVSYLWDFGDGTAFSAEETTEHIYTIAGVYIVTLTVEDAEGLTSTASITITVTEGEKMNIIFESNPPNSIDGVATVLVLNKPDNTEVIFITMHDIGGRYVSGHLPQDINTAPNTYEIPISNLRNGLYLIRVVMDAGDSTIVKLMVNN